MYSVNDYTVSVESIADSLLENDLGQCRVELTAITLEYKHEWPWVFYVLNVLNSSIHSMFHATSLGNMFIPSI
jgi:hypothetical protein